MRQIIQISELFYFCKSQLDNASQRAPHRSTAWVGGSNEICVEHVSEVHDAHEVTLITNKVNLTKLLEELHVEVQLWVYGSNEVCVELPSEVHNAH